jgi:hypothetical protein
MKITVIKARRFVYRFSFSTKSPSISSPSRSRLGVYEIMDDARGGFLGVSQSNTKPLEKPFFPSCWLVLKLRERHFYPELIQQMKPGSIILNRRQKESRTRNGADRTYTHTHTLVSRWRKVVEVDGDFVEK